MDTEKRKELTEKLEQRLFDELVNHNWAEGPNEIAHLVWTRSQTIDKQGNTVYTVCCETKNYDARFFPSYEKAYRSLARVISKVSVRDNNA